MGTGTMTGIPQFEPYTIADFSSLPHRIPQWKIDPNRAVLLLHDMQKYFIRPITAEPQKNSFIKNTMGIRKHSKKIGIPVAFTAQPGDMTQKQRGLLYDFWGNGMKSDDTDREIINELKPNAEDWLITKWRYSAFCRTDLLQRMRESNRDQIILCGVYAHIGVLMTAVDAFSHDIETFLIADAISDFSRAHHLMALNYAARCCAVVLRTDEVIT